jgi:hypothetical protein
MKLIKIKLNKIRILKKKQVKIYKNKKIMKLKLINSQLIIKINNNKIILKIKLQIQNEILLFK